MGALLSVLSWNKLGSGNFYASYERNFDRLEAYITKLKVRHCGRMRKGSLVSLCDGCEAVGTASEKRSACWPSTHCAPARCFLFVPQAQRLERQRRRQRLSSTIVWYSCALFAAIFSYAAWVSRPSQAIMHTSAPLNALAHSGINRAQYMMHHSDV